MLGGQHCHPEEQALLQDLFLQAAAPVALRMLAPELHLLERGSGQFNVVLPADIALWSGESPHLIASFPLESLCSKNLTSCSK